MGQISYGALCGLIGGFVVLLIVLFKKGMTCPECGNKIPKFRKPDNLKQLLWGGSTCSKCGCKVASNGKIESPSWKEKGSTRNIADAIINSGKNYCSKCNKKYSDAQTCPIHGTSLTSII